MVIDILTDTWPAISLAYEKCESDIMERKPRNPKLGGENLLINHRMIQVVYGQQGLIESLAAFFAYFVVMGENGFLPWDIIGKQAEWESEGVTNFVDSYGQEWALAQRQVLEYTCQTAYFDAVVVMQWADVIVRKTLRGSLWSQGMTNWSLNIALVFETAVAAFLTYCPGLGPILHTYPLRWQWWCPTLAFAVLLFAFDELRRLLIRKWPQGFFFRETYF